LARVDVDSGAVRVLAEAPYSGGLEGTWGDGVIVWSAIGGIRRIPAGGGEAALLLKDSQDANAAAPSFLPDGRRFLYTELKPRREDSRACIGSLDSPAPTCFWNETTPVKFAAPGYLLLARNGTFLAQPFDPSGPRTIGEPVTVSSELVAPNALYTPPSISASTNGVLAYFAGADSNQLRWLDRTGRPLGPPLGGGNRPTLSPDGTRLLVQRSERGTNNTDIWLLDLRDGTETRFTTSRVRENWPVFSSDGRLVAYAAEGGERSGLHVKATDGSGPDEALDTPGVNPDWSPDGRHLLYQLGNPKTGFDLFALSLTNRQTIPIAVTEHGEREGRFSPDGRWIAYDSTESGRREVWIQPFPPATSRWQVSTTGGVSPQWRRDGKELYYVRADGTLVAHEMRLSTGRPEWGTPQGLFQTLAGGGTYASYAPARDGQRFLLSLPPEPENAAPITVVVNWTSVLRN
jgi:hypothetical protein